MNRLEDYFDSIERPQTCGRSERADSAVRTVSLLVLIGLFGAFGFIAGFAAGTVFTGR